MIPSSYGQLPPHPCPRTHILAVEYKAVLCPSISFRRSFHRSSPATWSRLPDTVCITEDSWSGPMTEILALGHMKRNLGEYCCQRYRG